MAYPDAAWERAMTVQEVMMKALSGELHWFRAADILGFSPRTLRRRNSGCASRSRARRCSKPAMVPVCAQSQER